MQRTTRKQLDGTLGYVNAALARLGSSARVVAQGRCGYTGLDMYDTDGRCVRTLTVGTKRECKTFADGMAWALDALEEPHRSTSTVGALQD